MSPDPDRGHVYEHSPQPSTRVTTHARGKQVWTEQVCGTSYLTIQFPRPDASLTLCHQTALARHPVHPILVYGGSEGEILLWDLSAPANAPSCDALPDA